MRKEIIWGIVGTAAGFIGGYLTGRMLKKAAEKERPETPETETPREEPAADIPEAGNDTDGDSTVIREMYQNMVRVNYAAAPLDREDLMDLTEPIIKEEIHNVLDDIADDGIEIVNPDTIDPYTEEPDEQLIFCTDGVIVNEDHIRLEPAEVADLVGDAVSHFGDFEDDVVLIRNHYTGKLYEIVMDRDRTSKDIIEPDLYENPGLEDLNWPET